MNSQPGLFDAAEVTPPPTPAPGFQDITFHEQRARTLLNKIPGARPGGMAWTLNPYRGCTHACTYCFARDNHDRLGLDTGKGFNTQVVVKTNAADVLRRELRGGKTGDDWVMVGTSTDCYQRAEGHYRLMPGILGALAEYRVNFTTTTKSSLLRRDIPLFVEAARVANVLVMTSLGSLDERVWRAFEPGAAPPRARLATIAALRAAGVPAGVLIAPVIPHAGDQPAALDALVDACAEAGAVTLYPDVMRISPGARGWFLRQSAAHLPPRLHQRLAASYANSRAMPAPYVREVTAHLHARAAHHGLPRWEDYIREAGRRAVDSANPRFRDRWTIPMAGGNQLISPASGSSWTPRSRRSGPGRCRQISRSGHRRTWAPRTGRDAHPRITAPYLLHPRPSYDEVLPGEGALAMAVRTDGAGRRVENAVAWTIKNLDAVVAMGAALVIGLLEIFDHHFEAGIGSGATLLVLGALVYGNLAERRHRMADIREATTGAQRAIEDLVMVRSLSGGDLERALDRARQTTERWVFKGGTGTYLRAVTLPVCVQQARIHRRPLSMKIDIVNPADERACAAYARFRQTFAHRLEFMPSDVWSADRARKESFATVLAVCWYRQRLDTLEADVYLSSGVPTLRFDLSDSCLIITQDDPRRANLLVERDRPLYDYYVTELHQSREQAATVDLRRAEPLSEEPTVDEAHRLFESIGLSLPTAFSERDVGEILDKALHAENPYRR